MARVTKALISQVMTELGKRGGKRSAETRSGRLSPEQRSAIARKAALARWGKLANKRERLDAK